MRFSELKGRAVVSLDDATKIGEVEDLMVDPVSLHVVSLRVHAGHFKAPLTIPAGDVQSVGADAVTLTTNSTLAGAPSPDTDTGPDSAASAAPAVELTSVLGTKVVTDAGTLVGRLSDVVLDWSQLAITGYEVHEGGLFAKAQVFAASPDVHWGDKIITIPAALFSQPA